VRKANGSHSTTTAAQAIKPTKKMGTSGTAVWGGVPQTKEKDVQLVGSNKWKNFSEILVNTAIVGASVRYFQRLLAQAVWTTEPADDSPEAKEYAELALDMLHDMETPWSRVVRRTAMYLFNGFGVQEWTAKRRPDGRIGLLDIEPRPCHTIVEWDVDETGDVKGVVQESPWTFEWLYLPRGKLVYAVEDSITDSPDGIGLLRHVYPHSKQLADYERAEKRGFETDLRGVPLAAVPLRVLAEMKENGDLQKDEYDAILAQVRGWIDNHIRGESTGFMYDSQPYTSQDAAATPSATPMWNFELLQGDNGPFTDVANAISRKLHDIARLFGTEFLLLGGDTTSGSYAQAKAKMENFFLMVDGVLMDLASIYERDVFGPVWRLNGWPDEMKPDLKVEKVRFQSVDEITKALVDLSQAGSPLDINDPAEGAVRDLLGLPRAERLAAEEDAALYPKPSRQGGMYQPPQYPEQPPPTPAPAPVTPPAQQPKPGAPGDGTTTQGGAA